MALKLENNLGNKFSLTHANNAGEINLTSKDLASTKLVDSIAELKLINGSTANKLEVLGYYEKGDGGGGLFYWDSTSTEEDNGGTIIQATGVTTGRWKRVYSGAINVKWFGAKGDGINDDTSSIQNAINYGDTNLDVGVYKITNSIIVPSDREIKGESGSIIHQINYDNSSTISIGTEYAGFKILENSSNIIIDNIELRGPFYGTTINPSYRSIGIAIEGRYDYYFYNNPNYPGQPATLPSGESNNIKISNCIIDGWGQSGILADNINDFYCNNNIIKNITRDGIRMYGCRNFIIESNTIDNMSNGFPLEGISPNFNVYGITATRVYNDPTNTGSTQYYPVSKNGLISNNIVSNCANWKALDAHGGVDITFSSNIITNAHIGIGIDKGGFNTSDGYAPPRNIKIINNTIKAGASNVELHRAGIAVFGHDSTTLNIASDIIISGNSINGFGLDNKDGGIVVSNADRVSINDNQILNSLGRNISFQNVITNAMVQSNIFTNTLKTNQNVCSGVNLSNAQQLVKIDDNIFRQSTTIGEEMTAILTVLPDSGFGAVVGDNNIYNGVVKKLQSPAHMNNDSSLKRATLGYCNINNIAGVLTVIGGVNVVSATWVSVGVVEVIFNTNATVLFPFLTFKGSATIGYASYSGNKVTINTRNLANAAIDTGFYLEIKGF